MKKAPLIHLVKCEFILFRKDIILSVLTLICIVFICVMWQLSMEIGNLALLPFEDKQMMNFLIPYIPVFLQVVVLMEFVKVL